MNIINGMEDYSGTATTCLLLLKTQEVMVHYEDGMDQILL
jgi:hypothetical protein